MSRLRLAIDQIRFARKYTLGLLDAVEPDDWFRRPAEGATHVAWQVGHLAMAEYRLALERIRGSRASDAALIAPDFLERFGRGSTPSADPGDYPSAEEIRATFDRVHAAALAELPQLADEELDNPPLKPHRLYHTKLGSLHWRAQHEMLHAGQIGLLRRLLGYEPLW
jgi:uncharacterized damage-inducible protein DinB